MASNQVTEDPACEGLAVPEDYWEAVGGICLEKLPVGCFLLREAQEKPNHIVQIIKEKIKAYNAKLAENIMNQHEICKKLQDIHELLLMGFESSLPVRMEGEVANTFVEKLKAVLSDSDDVSQLPSTSSSGQSNNGNSAVGAMDFYQLTDGLIISEVYVPVPVPATREITTADEETCHLKPTSDDIVLGTDETLQPQGQVSIEDYCNEITLTYELEEEQGEDVHVQGKESSILMMPSEIHNVSEDKNSEKNKPASYSNQISMKPCRVALWRLEDELPAGVVETLWGNYFQNRPGKTKRSNRNQGALKRKQLDEKKEPKRICPSRSCKKTAT